VKFTEKGKVTVRLDCSHPAGSPHIIDFVLAVCDTGIGMTADVAERIFNKFTQGDSSTTRKYGGTGLGLTISKQLAELMGGTITVKSEPGRGTEFALILPLSAHA